MNKINKYLIVVLVIIILIIGAIFGKQKFDDLLVSRNATILNRYDELIEAGYQDIDKGSYYDAIDSYIEATNAQTDRIVGKSETNDGMNQYYLAIGTKQVPQILMKLETNMDKIDEDALPEEPTEDDLIELFNEVSDDKLTLSLFAGDNIHINNRDISNNFAEVKFTLKSFFVAKSFDFKGFSPKSCSSGTFDLSDTTDQHYIENETSCQKIFGSSNFSELLNEIYIDEE